MGNVDRFIFFMLLAGVFVFLASVTDDRAGAALLCIGAGVLLGAGITELR
jgi:hypothetical protein